MKYDQLLAQANVLMALPSTHAYLGREHTKYALHPVIKAALDERGFELADTTALLLEWPHVSEDGLRIAYTRTVEHGSLDRQTVSAIGKYLTRHFTQARADQIRDLAVLFNQSEETVCSFTKREVEAYVNAVQSGPSSCMKRSSYDHANSGDAHPYAVYAPEFGWHMAVEKRNGAIWGRCVCLEHEGRKLFVRSYSGNPEATGHSGTSTLLEAWLLDQGYTKTYGWPHGAKLALIHGDEGIVAPYIDGDLYTAYESNDCLVLDSCSDYELRETSGWANENGNRERCEDCNEYYNAETMESIGYGGNYSVCCGCREDHYVYVIGCRGSEYYIHTDGAIEVNGQDYDFEHLAENNIVKITAGSMADEYEEADNTVTDFFGSVWHESDVVETVPPPTVQSKSWPFSNVSSDSAVILLTAGCYQDRFYPADQTWQCEGTGLIYSDCDDSTVVDDLVYESTWYANNQQQLLDLNADLSTSKVEGNHHV